MSTSPANEMVTPPAPARLPEIYGFVNGGSADWWNVSALSEDGEFLAGHVCSHPSFGPHDIGVTSDWKHEIYRERYPQGFTVLWVEAGDPRLVAAYAKHVEAGELGTEWQREKAGRLAAEPAAEQQP